MKLDKENYSHKIQRKLVEEPTKALTDIKKISRLRTNATTSNKPHPFTQDKLITFFSTYEKPLSEKPVNLTLQGHYAAGPQAVFHKSTDLGASSSAAGFLQKNQQSGGNNDGRRGKIRGRQGQAVTGTEGTRPRCDKICQSHRLD